MHQRFEELCALAVTGQITGDAMAALDRHVKECGECRAFLQDLVPLKANVAPVVAAARANQYTTPDGMRERFLQRAAAAGVAMQPGPVLMPAPVVPAAPVAPMPAAYDFMTQLRAWWVAAGKVALPVAASLACGVAGYFLAQRVHSPAQVAPVRAAVQPATQASPTAPASAVELAAAQQRIAGLSTELEKARVEKRSLMADLQRTAQRASAGAQMEEQFKAAAQKLQDADGRIAQLTADLDTERKKQATNDAILVAQQRVAVEAKDRAANLEAQLAQAREERVARIESGDLIAARNLHIVDVYDSESDGKRQRPFGRVFYVEGKSLVFYAYDLAAPKGKDKKVEFKVWGETAGVKSVSYSLGTLQSDDDSQRRWVLACDDPKVLTRINAVYLTAETGNPPKHEPRGRKMMYAFLGSPNHP